MPLTGGAEKWQTVAQTPRSLLEPGANKWLASILGDPSKISCQVSQTDSDGLLTNSSSVQAMDLNLQAIDFVWLANVKNDGGATELEARVAAKYRQVHPDLSAEISVKIDFAQTGTAEANVRSFAAILPLMAYLRQLLAGARAANAQDFVPPVQTDSNAASNPTGVDLTELLTRITTAKSNLLSEITIIENAAPNADLPQNEDNPGSFKPVFEQIAAQGQDPDTLKSIVLNHASREKLAAFRLVAALYGVASAYPGHLNVVTEQTDVDWLLQTAAVWKTVVDRCLITEKYLQNSQTPNVGFSEKIAALVSAGKALFGEDFVIIPRFKYQHTAGEATQRPNDDAAQLLTYFTNKYQTTPSLAMEEWSQGLARVRPAIARLDRVRTFADLLGLAVPTLVPMQTPFRKNDSWLGLEYPETDFSPRNNAVTLAACGAISLAPDTLHSVLNIDDWTESVPAQQETTAVAYHYNQPNATPPQTLLMAIHPRDEAKWGWSDLINILEDTLARAKRRAVEPRHFSQDAVLSQFLPAVVADFSLPGYNISLDFAVTNPAFMQSIKTISNAIYLPFE